MNLSQLHRLIQSLDIKEKTQLTKYFKSHKTKQYVKLYGKLKKEDLKFTNSLKKVSRSSGDDLLKHILNCLRDYSSKENTSISKEIKNLLLEAEFLFDKEFYQECWTKLEKAKNKAISIYQFSSTLEANQMMMKVLTKKNVKTKFIAESLFKDLKEYTKEFADYIFENELYTKLLFLARENLKNPDIDDIKGKFSEKINTRLIKTRTSSLTISEYRHLQSSAIYYRLIGKRSQGIKVLKKALDWWEQKNNEIYKKEEIHLYILTVINLIHYLLEDTGFVNERKQEILFKEVDQALNKIRPILLSDGIEHYNTAFLKIRIAYFKVALSNAIRKEDFKEGDDLIGKVNKILENKEYLTFLDKKILCFYKIQHYFGKKDFLFCKKAIEYFEELEKKEKPGIRIGLSSQIFPYKILTHISLKYKEIKKTEIKIKKIINQGKILLNNQDNHNADYYINYFDYLAAINEAVDSRNRHSIFNTTGRLYIFLKTNDKKPYAYETKRWLTIFNNIIIQLNENI